MLNKVTRDSTDKGMRRPGQSRPPRSQVSRAGTGKQWTWQSTSNGQGESSHTYTANPKTDSRERKAVCGQTERQMCTFKAHKNTLEHLGVERGRLSITPIPCTLENATKEYGTRVLHFYPGDPLGTPKCCCCSICRNITKCLWAKKAPSVCPFYWFMLVPEWST